MLRIDYYTDQREGKELFVKFDMAEYAKKISVELPGRIYNGEYEMG